MALFHVAQDQQKQLTPLILLFKEETVVILNSQSVDIKS